MTQQIRINKGLWWDRAWSVVSGCTPVSPACAHCWSAAEASMRSAQKNPKIRARYAGLTTARAFNGTVRCNIDLLDLPLRERKPTTWAIWTDLFHEQVDSRFIDRVWHTMHYLRDRHQFIILTKRPGRMADYLAYHSAKDLWQWPLPNVWLGVTVEDQQRADERIPLLLQCPAAVRFLSLEPLLGPVVIPDTITSGVDGRDGIWFDPLRPNNRNAINWVIAGAETGAGARPSKPEWFRSIRDQCRDANVPFFMKSLGKDNVIPNDLSIREIPSLMA